MPETSGTESLQGTTASRDAILKRGSKQHRRERQQAEMSAKATKKLNNHVLFFHKISQKTVG
jgi:hypothetical protein